MWAFILALFILVATLVLGDNSRASCEVHLLYEGRESLLLLDNKNVINDLSDHFSNRLSPPVLSFQARKDCRLRLSYSTYLTGNILQYEGPFEGLSFGSNVPLSAACDCGKKCSCENIRLPEGECARAYLNSDCSNCDASFRVIRPGPSNHDHSKWSQINSFVLRENCNLTLAQEDKHGLKISVLDTKNSNVHKNAHLLGRIRTIECSCPRTGRPEETTSSSASEKTPPMTIPPITPTPKPPTTSGTTMAPLTTTTMAPPELFPTPVSIQLDRAYQLLNDSMKDCHPNLLPKLKKAFQLQNLTNLHDIPKSPEDIMKLLLQIEINSVTLFILKNAFHLQPPVFPEDFKVGSGYSLQNKEILSLDKIFDLGDDTTSKVILQFPEGLNINIKNSWGSCFKLFRDEDSFLKAKLEDFNLPTNSFPVVNLTKLYFNKDPCFNFLPHNSSSWNKLSATVNFLNFNVHLKENVKLTPQFSRHLSALRPYNISNPISVYLWNQFFTTYGTHVITSASAGGSIQIQVKLLDPEEDDAEESLKDFEKLTILSKTIGAIFKSLEYSHHNVTFPGPLTSDPRVIYKLSQIGGNPAHHVPDISHLSTVQNVAKWRESLQYHPAILPSSLKLVPLSKIVYKFGHQVSHELPFWIDQAMEDIFPKTKPEVTTASPPTTAPPTLPPVVSNFDEIWYFGQAVNNVTNIIQTLQYEMLHSFNKSDTSHQNEIKNVQEQLKNLTEMLSHGDNYSAKVDVLTNVTVTVRKLSEQTQQLLDIQKKNPTLPDNLLADIREAMGKENQKLRGELKEFMEKKFEILISYVNSQGNRIEDLIQDKIDSHSLNPFPAQPPVPSLGTPFYVIGNPTLVPEGIDNGLRPSSEVYLVTTENTPSKGRSVMDA